MDVKSGRSGAHKPDKVGLSCKVKNVATPALGTSECYLSMKYRHALVMPAKPAKGACHDKYK